MINTYLLFLFIEIINDDSNKQVKSEERTENNKEHEVEIHVNVSFSNWLLVELEINPINPNLL